MCWGEYGAVAIQEALRTEGVHPVPSIRTVGRILVRAGAIDARQRVRRPAPPPGWHLPVVAQRAAELEQFDVIEDLKLADGPLIDGFTGVAVHSGWPQAQPLLVASTTRILACLRAHWRAVGLPGYAQFDNDTRFQGAHQHPDVFGRVSRFCLHVGVTPVFVPPREFGLQNAIEHFNGLFQAKVWRRFRFPSLTTFVAHAARYVAARRHRLAARASGAPARRPWDAIGPFQPERLPPGRVIYIRRTDAHGRIHLLGHTWPVATHWCHRLVRAELDLATEHLACFALRRSAPHDQPLLRLLRYQYPRADLGW